MNAPLLLHRPKVSVYMGVSLDLQIAAADGALDFLTPYQGGATDYGYAQFMSTVDALIMGRHTFDSLMGYNVPWPFGERPVIVATSRPLPDAPSTVSTHAGALTPCLASLAARGVSHVYVDGGAIVRQALNEGVVDEMTLSIVPEILGTGRPLFSQDLPRTSWTLVGVESWPSGLSQLRYVRRAD